MKKVLIVTHVGGLVPQFEMNNVRILQVAETVRKNDAAPTDAITRCVCSSPNRRQMRTACLLMASIERSSGVFLSSASPV